jgi:hypothetical protein
MKLAKTAAVYLIVCVTALALLAALAPYHPTQPPFDDPTVYGSCSEIEWQYDTGAEQLLGQSSEDYDEEGETVPYLFQNGPYTEAWAPSPPACNSRAQGVQYATAGELGASVWIELRTNPISEIPADARGLVMWSGDWKPPLYISPAWGWSALRFSGVYAVWEFTEGEKVMLNIDGDPEPEHIGWQRLYTNPSNPALEGARVFLQGLIANAALDEGELSETWMVTFTDVIP